MKLKSLDFKGDRRLELAASNSPPMRLHERNRSVFNLKIALFRYGHIRETFFAMNNDLYDAETKDAVMSFQRVNKLKPDGVAGHYTIQLLDELLYLEEGGVAIVPTPGVAPFGPFIALPSVVEGQRETLRAQRTESRAA